MHCRGNSEQAEDNFCIESQDSMMVLAAEQGINIILIYIKIIADYY